MNTHREGRRYEDIAARHLVGLGWSIVDRNVRFRRNEIDLIVTRDAVVAFVEVKGRSGVGFGHPLSAVTPRKRREIERVAAWWVARNGPVLRSNWGCEPTYRFDGVAIVDRGRGCVAVHHVEDAWRPAGPPLG